MYFFFFQAEDGIRDKLVTGVQTCALPIFFTGRLPFEHGIRDNFSKPLDPGTPTLASILKERGYATGGFIGAYPVSRDRSEERRVGKSVDLGGRRIIKKKKNRTQSAREQYS